MNRTIKFKITHGPEKNRQVTILNLEKDIIDIKKYINPVINQFSGFTDDYGNEIYEGSTIKIEGHPLSDFKVLNENGNFIVKSNDASFFLKELNLNKFLLWEKELMKKMVIDDTKNEITK